MQSLELSRVLTWKRNARGPVAAYLWHPCLLLLPCCQRLLPATMLEACWKPPGRAAQLMPFQLQQASRPLLPRELVAAGSTPRMPATTGRPSQGPAHCLNGRGYGRTQAVDRSDAEGAPLEWQPAHGAACSVWCSSTSVPALAPFSNSDRHLGDPPAMACHRSSGQLPPARQAKAEVRTLLAQSKETHDGCVASRVQWPGGRACGQMQQLHLRPKGLPQLRVVPPNAALCIEGGRQRPPHALPGQGSGGRGRASGAELAACERFARSPHLELPVEKILLGVATNRGYARSQQRTKQGELGTAGSHDKHACTGEQKNRRGGQARAVGAGLGLGLGLGC